MRSARAGSSLARQQAVGAHAGKQVEKDFRQPLIRPLPRDDDVAGQGGLEPTAESVAVDEGNCHDGEDRAPPHCCRPPRCMLARRPVSAGRSCARTPSAKKARSPPMLKMPGNRDPTTKSAERRLLDPGLSANIRLIARCISASSRRTPWVKLGTPSGRTGSTRRCRLGRS